MTMKNNISD